MCGLFGFVWEFLYGQPLIENLESSVNILIIGAKPKSLILFRGDFIRKLGHSGYSVTTMAASGSPEVSAISSRLSDLGAKYCSYPIQRNGLNPFKDLETFIFLYKFFRHTKPDIILAYTIKPVIWGGLAASIAGKSRFYGLITGLGFALEGQGFRRKVLKFTAAGLYRLALLKAQRVIFQNSDNKETFVGSNIVAADKCAIVNGSGVNVDHFNEMPFLKGATTFLLIARLLGEKGIREYYQAARKVKAQYPDVIFNLVGAEDPSPDGVTLAEVQGWHEEGIIQYLGTTNDVRPYIAHCHVYVLPSYHEGIPRTVLEAMAMGRPILTTDVPGCRETVASGVNGYLVPSKDANALAERMIYFIEHPENWLDMGKQSRRLAKEKFDVRKVNQKLFEIMGL